MKAAVLVQSKAPLEVVDLKLPDELVYGQVHVKIHFSGICGAQINEIEATKGPDKFLPHLLGHEASGTVLGIGPGVKTVRPNDRVVLHWRPSAGIQSEAPKYDWNGRTVNAGWVTTFNEEAFISENRLTVIPDTFPLRLAPLFGCAITTATGVVNNDAQVKIGQSIVIFGCGGVGLNIAQAADMVSANPIVGVDVIDKKVEMGLRWGLTHAFNSATCADIRRKILDVVGSKGADVVIDTTGNARVIEMAYELTQPDGRTILVGVPRKDDKVSIYTLPLHFKKVLKGSEGGGVVPDVEIPRLIRLVERGRLRLEGLITHEFALDDINEAIRVFRSGEAGRVLINMGTLR
ncbi:MAG: dehydrogenase [Betaproteobacteria bacterium]|nr:MAG: dehydrogenase [Betaproteobacteria bacterium]